MCQYRDLTLLDPSITLGAGDEIAAALLVLFYVNQGVDL